MIIASIRIQKFIQKYLCLEKILESSQLKLFRS